MLSGSPEAFCLMQYSLVRVLVLMARRPSSLPVMMLM
jgi:hypothetical protein